MNSKMIFVSRCPISVSEKSVTDFERLINSLIAVPSFLPLFVVNP